MRRRGHPPRTIRGNRAADDPRPDVSRAPMPSQTEAQRIQDFVEAVGKESTIAPSHRRCSRVRSTTTVRESHVHPIAAMLRGGGKILKMPVLLSNAILGPPTYAPRDRVRRREPSCRRLAGSSRMLLAGSRAPPSSRVRGGAAFRICALSHFCRCYHTGAKRLLVVRQLIPARPAQCAAAHRRLDATKRTPLAHGVR